jgi:hypothetical protein
MSVIFIDEEGNDSWWIDEELLSILDELVRGLSYSEGIGEFHVKGGMENSDEIWHGAVELICK